MPLADGQARTSVFQRVKLAYEKGVFFPAPWNLLTNSFYFSRRGLWKGIAKHAHVLQGTLLDFGCGSKPYQEMFSVDDYIGVDIATSGHDHTDSKMDVFYDGRVLPFRDGAFDAVFASEVFEHVFNLDEILGELRRVIHPEGTMLLTMPFCWDQHEVPFDAQRYTEWGLRYLLSKHGFDVIAHEKTTTYVETLASLIGAYFYKHFFPRHRVLSKITHLLVVSPVFLLASLLSPILPNNGHLYLNHVVLARPSQTTAVHETVFTGER